MMGIAPPAGIMAALEMYLRAARYANPPGGGPGRAVQISAVGTSTGPKEYHSRQRLGARVDRQTTKSLNIGVSPRQQSAGSYCTRGTREAAPMKKYFFDL